MASVSALRFFLFLYFAFFSTSPVLGKSTPLFACDVKTNPSQASFGFCNMSLGVTERVADLVKRLTLHEKFGFLLENVTSVSRLGIPIFKRLSEGLHGVSSGGFATHFNNEVPAATIFPQVILTAASFNASLFEAIGKAVSTEARAMHNQGLTGLSFWAPNVNIFRDPRWGRGQETPGEDPKLSSEYATSFVRGMQGRDSDKLKVAAYCKHYTAYDLESWNGTDRFHFNAVVTKQDLEDTFQPPFRSCVVDGNAAGVICSYNQVNGKPACADADLLSGVIRGQLELNGSIVSDCEALKFIYIFQHYTKTPEETVAKSILAGLDLNCGTFLGQHIDAAVQEGLVNESAIDRAISNNIATLMRLGFFDGDPREQLYGNLGPKDVCSPEHQELALEAGRQGIVVLKNSPGSLPLSPTAIKNLAVIGPNANITETMLGSFYGPPCKYTTPLKGLAASVAIAYEAGCFGSSVSCIRAELDGAKKIAASSDATVLIMGADVSIEKEGLDRINILLPGQQELLIAEVANVSKGPVILGIMSGSGMDISFAKTNDKITSILWVGYPGEAGGAAIADIIFGRYNPSRRLPMTWYPQSYVNKVPMTNMNMRPDPSNGYPGRTYRFYTGETVYSFGDGLSYSQIQHEIIGAPQTVPVPLKDVHVCSSSLDCRSVDAFDETCQDLAFDLDLKVVNLGRMKTSHTVLLFSSPPSVHNSPQKQLLDFKKVSLDAGEGAIVRFKVDVCKHLSVVDEVGSRKLGLGEHVLHVGNLQHPLIVTI